jgi:hypothetical protein
MKQFQASPRIMKYFNNKVIFHHLPLWDVIYFAIFLDDACYRDTREKERFFKRFYFALRTNIIWAPATHASSLFFSSPHRQSTFVYFYNLKQILDFFFAASTAFYGFSFKCLSRIFRLWSNDGSKDDPHNRS